MRDVGRIAMHDVIFINLSYSSLNELLLKHVLSAESKTKTEDLFLNLVVSVHKPSQTLTISKW